MMHDVTRRAEAGERFFRDACVYRIDEGTTQIVQLKSAKHMLREPHSGGMG